jgi:hypothetical protein
MSILETNINYELTKVLSKDHYFSPARQTTSNFPKPNQSKPDPTKTISNGINLAKSEVTRQKSVHPTLDGQPPKGHQCVGSLAKGKNLLSRDSPIQDRPRCAYPSFLNTSLEIVYTENSCGLQNPKIGNFGKKMKIRDGAVLTLSKISKSQEKDKENLASYSESIVDPFLPVLCASKIDYEYNNHASLLKKKIVGKKRPVQIITSEGEQVGTIDKGDNKLDSQKNDRKIAEARAHLRQFRKFSMPLIGGMDFQSPSPGVSKKNLKGNFAIKPGKLAKKKSFDENMTELKWKKSEQTPMAKKLRIENRTEKISTSNSDFDNKIIEL